MTIILTKATYMADILNKLGGMSEVELIEEKLVTEKIRPSLLKKATALPKLKNRLRETIFVTLGKN